MGRWEFGDGVELGRGSGSREMMEKGRWSGGGGGEREREREREREVY